MSVEVENVDWEMLNFSAQFLTVRIKRWLWWCGGVSASLRPLIRFKGLALNWNTWMKKTAMTKFMMMNYESASFQLFFLYCCAISDDEWKNVMIIASKQFKNDTLCWDSDKRLQQKNVSFIPSYHRPAPVSVNFVGFPWNNAMIEAIRKNKGMMIKAVIYICKILLAH